ncbi:MAG: HAD family hydrolase, partial [Candidatus Eremiobacteraeota bacterium]|nr:HAD family hydrolase [Candidatus Eremiobacteraeota bacterium]
AAIGDADNDVPMLHAAQYSYAVGNASPAAKAAAAVIVGPQAAGGVAEALQALISERAHEPA